MPCRFVIFAILALIAAPTAASQSGSDPMPAAEAFAGQWSGVLEVGPQTLRLELEIETDGPEPAGTLISVDQGGARIPLDEFSIAGDRIEFGAPKLSILFSGALEGDRIEGVFHQGGFQSDLSFERGGLDHQKTAAVHPASAANPADRSIEIRSGDVALAGALRLPKAEDAVPGLVILSGSGPQDRDGTIAGQPVYRALADLLEDLGIASLRLDDRGVGQSDDTAAASPAELAGDATAAVEFLRKEPAIGCVGILGHSEGGLIALLAAPRADPAFIVTLAGMHAPLEDILRAQGTAILSAAGASEKQMAETRMAQQAVFDAIAQAEGPDASDEIEAALVSAGLDPDAAAAQARIWGQPYAVALFSVDADDAASDYAGPLLAFFGENDLQVPPDVFAERLAQQRGDLPIDIRIVDGVDHLFQESESGLPQDYGSAGHALAPAARKALSDGIADLVQNACKNRGEQ